MLRMAETSPSLSYQQLSRTDHLMQNAFTRRNIVMPSHFINMSILYDAGNLEFLPHCVIISKRFSQTGNPNNRYNLACGLERYQIRIPKVDI
jgi:hypothetical protein